MTPDVARYLTFWNTDQDGDPVETRSSRLVPVRFRDQPAMLKVLRPDSDEAPGFAWLRYVDGDGAVRVFAADDRALLMERAVGTGSLMAMAVSGGDAAAAEILAAAVARLHAPRPRVFPAGLTPLDQWFTALFQRAAIDRRLAGCAAVAKRLLASPREVAPLHGDLHHDNVLDCGPRGWLAIDPKGLLGERTYDIANLLGNPWPHGEVVHDTARMRRIAALYAARLDLDLDRVLAFAYAHAGLSASWSLEEGGDPTYRLRCAAVIEPLLREI